MRRQASATRGRSAVSLNNLGLVQQDSGNQQAALDAFDQALRIRREIGDLVGVSRHARQPGHGRASARRGRQGARLLFRRLTRPPRRRAIATGIALILTNLGATLQPAGRRGEGDPRSSSRPRTSPTSWAIKLGLAEARRGFGKAYLARREFAKARDCTRRAVDLFAEAESKVQLGVALRSLGEVTEAAAEGDNALGEAAEHLKRSIAIFEEIGNDVELARSCRAYAALLRRMPEHARDATVAARGPGDGRPSRRHLREDEGDGRQLFRRRRPMSAGGPGSG